MQGRKNQFKKANAERNVHLISNAQIFYERNTESRYDSENRRQFNILAEPKVENRKLMPPAGVLRSVSNNGAMADTISPRDHYNDSPAAVSNKKYADPRSRAAALPPAGSRSLLKKGIIDSDLSFTPGVYESMSKKAIIKSDANVRYSQHAGIYDGRQ